MRHIVTAIALTAVLAGDLEAKVTTAYLITGNDAYSLCQGNEMWCIGFVSGALDMAAALNPPNVSYCLPLTVKAGQMTDVFKKALTENPEIRDKPAVFILLEKLAATYPCH
jgi:hypothetical protein